MRVVMKELSYIKDMVMGVDRKIENHLVTKDQLKLHVSEVMGNFHRSTIDPMQKKIESNEIKANWALRAIFFVLSVTGLAVLGAILKTSLNI